jgi:hypothetical protein
MTTFNVARARIDQRFEAVSAIMEAMNGEMTHAAKSSKRTREF